MDEKLKKYFEIQEINNSIKEIDDELNTVNHDIKKFRNINKKAKIKFPLETSAHEIGTTIQTRNMVSIDKASEVLLLDRLPFYKSLYEFKLASLSDNE